MKRQTEGPGIDGGWMRRALRLARKAYGFTSPNPLVGAVLVKRGAVIGQGWHHRAGEPHAEIEALTDAARRGAAVGGATLYVTLEPCCTHGRTPPCTDAILQAGIRRVVVGATDPNPKHAGRGLEMLRENGVEVVTGLLAPECAALNEAFNHWIVHRTPFVVVKSAMTLDGKIATAAGQSKWITGPLSRQYAMKLRQGPDAIVVGVNTVLLDDPQLVVRSARGEVNAGGKRLRRIVLDRQARTPLTARLLNDEHRDLTTVVVGEGAPERRVRALARRANVVTTPFGRSDPRAPARLDLRWLLKHLGNENVTSVLVEGGGEVNASFLMGGLAHKIAFFYAPRILGGKESRKAVGGSGAASLEETLKLERLRWRRIGPDWLLTAYLAGSAPAA